MRVCRMTSLCVHSYLLQCRMRYAVPSLRRTLWTSRHAGALATSRRLTWVEALKGVEGWGGGQLEGQRGQGVLLPKNGCLTLANSQNLGVLVQGDVRVDGQGRKVPPSCRLLLRGALRLLLEALRLRLTCSSTPHVASPSSHMRRRAHPGMIALFVIYDHIICGPGLHTLPGCGMVQEFTMQDQARNASEA